MDKKKLLSKVERKELLDNLSKKAQERKYIARNVNLKVNSLDKGNGLTEVRGELIIRVTEDASSEDAWKEAKFSVMMFDDTDKLGQTVMKVVSNVYSVSNDYGDSIFEDGFYNILSGEVEELVS
jgi:hypothetical protein